MDNLKNVFGNPVPATLCEDITYFDVDGNKRTWSKDLMVRVYIIPCNSAYTNGKVYKGRTKKDNYLAVYGRDSVTIDNTQFKCID